MGISGARVGVEVLGPLRLVVDGATVEVPGPKRRAVLTLLALAEGRTVTVDHLVDALWPSEMPQAARQALHTHVSRLRSLLGAAAPRLQTRHDGYRLDLTADDLDASRARALLAAARREPVAALAMLREAHALWRGPVLADLTDIAPIAVAVEACARLRREVTDAFVAAAVDAGRSEDVLGQAAAAHAEDPLREPAVLLLMRALSATGQAPEALRVGRDFRRRLADETGLDPSPALDELERTVAAGAAGPAPRPVPPRARPLTRLIGRAAEVAALNRLLASERMVTVVGAGGVGKTRVALEVAQRAHAATVLPLAPVTDPAAIPAALASALRLDVVQGDVLAACVALLGDRPGLLVVDNCEHLLGAVRDMVETVLVACPRLAVLATGREPVGMAVECAYRLGPLPLPGPEPDPSEVPSVAVFLERAGRVRPGAPPTRADLRLVADIVRRLDGLPLAIELAAGRLSTFSLADLHARLDRSLDLLGAGGPGADVRHRTLRATVEWSYDLLTEDERRLFRYLSVFVDGADLDAVERLGADLGLAADPDTVLSRLVDASMIDADFADGTRYRMLETLRAFGRDRLAAAGEDDEACRHMLRWAVGLTTAFAAGIASEREPEADAALRREVANLRAAWRLARRMKAVDEAAALVAGLYDAIAYRDLLEFRGWAEELARDFVDDPALAEHPRAAAVLASAAEAVYHRGDYASARRLAEAGLARATDDESVWMCRSVLSVADLAARPTPPRTPPPCCPASTGRAPGRPCPTARRSSRSRGRPSSGISAGAEHVEGGRAAAGGLDERLVADPRGVGVEAEGGDEAARLGGLRRQRPHLAGRDLGVQHEVDGQVLPRGDDRIPGCVDVEALRERTPPERTLVVDGGVQQPRPRGGGRVEGGARPRRDGPVVGMPGEPVRPEGQHGVRPDPVDDLGEQPHRRRGVGVGAPAVAVGEPVMLADAEDVQTSGQLARPFGGEPVWRPGERVGGAAFAAGGGHADHALSVAAGQRHQAAGQVGLVVGMGPDSEDGAELGHTGR